MEDAFCSKLIRKEISVGIMGAAITEITGLRRLVHILCVVNE